MNKKLIRLTESDLHRIVKESVNRILNEIGDTEKGQEALGALSAARLTGKRKGDKWEPALRAHRDAKDKIDAEEDRVSNSNEPWKAPKARQDMETKLKGAYKRGYKSQIKK